MIAQHDRSIRRNDGKKPHDVSADGALMSVPVETGATLSWKPARELFRQPILRGGGVIRSAVHYDVTPDGQRFVAVLSSRQNKRPTLNAFINWTSALKTQP